MAIIDNMFNIFRKPNFKSGALEDNRTIEEKEFDYKASEVFSASYPWIKTRENDKNSILESIKNYPQYDQDGSCSCVANALGLNFSKANLSEEGVALKFSPRSIYPFRSNAPAGGMIGANACDLAVKKGMVLSLLMPHDKYSEEKMNDASDYIKSYEQIAQIYKPANYIYVDLTWDDIADMIENRKLPVMIFLKFGDEYWSPAPVHNPNGIKKYGHAVTPVAAYLKDGVKTLLIQDSAGLGTCMNGRYRELSICWEKNLTFAVAFIDLKNDWKDGVSTDTSKPKYEFKNELKYGMLNNEDVKKLQDCLKYLSFFPKTISSTGNFYGITKTGVKAFQSAYNVILTSSELSGNVGPNTLIKLNSLFS